MGIARTESTYGNNPAQNTTHNVAGLTRGSGGYQRHTSYEQSIRTLGDTLSRLYIKHGKVTPEKIAQTYCPVNLENWGNATCDEMIRLYDKYERS